MTPPRLCLLTALLLLGGAGHAWADNAPRTLAVANGSAKELDQIVYKGLVGNALDGIPMDPSRRVSLQRTNAIVSNTWSGHTLSTLAGLSNPLLLIGGLVWGVWAASNIMPEGNGVQAPSELIEPGASAASQKSLTALVDELPATAAATQNLLAESNPHPLARPPVVKVWLSQRAPTAGTAP